MNSDFFKPDPGTCQKVNFLSNAWILKAYSHIHSLFKKISAAKRATDTTSMNAWLLNPFFDLLCGRNFAKFHVPAVLFIFTPREWFSALFRSIYFCSAPDRTNRAGHLPAFANAPLHESHSQRRRQRKMRARAPRSKGQIGWYGSHQSILCDVPPRLYISWLEKIDRVHPPICTR